MERRRSGISPLVDFAFKLMLGSPQHTGVTMHFLNSILTDQPTITQVKILNPFLGKDSVDDKLSVLDILATDEHGRFLNIEMQTSLPSGMSQRLAYYVSTVYVGQLHEGDQYSELRPAISICVLTQAMFPESPELHLDFRLRESSSELILTDDLQIHLLQLNNLRVTAENVYDALPAERWAYFLQNADKLTPEEIPRIFSDEEMAEARGRLEGEEIGKARGLKLGRITLLQELLGIRPSAVEEFAGFDEMQIQELEEQLQHQLRSRG